MLLRVLKKRIKNPLAIEIVRDRIADILVVELANQKQLAIDDGDETTPYDILVVQEKSDPWSVTEMPVVNIWYDTGNILEGESSVNAQQQGFHYYNLDCYVNKTSEVQGGDIEAGDTKSAIEVHRVAGLVWQILMADVNCQLQFPMNDVGGIAEYINDGNIGDGTLTDLDLSDTGAPATIGSWLLKCVQALPNSGRFTLEDPDGYIVADDIIIPNGGGQSIVYDNYGLTFKITDGDTDFAVDDSFTIHVTPGKPIQFVGSRIFEQFTALQPAYADNTVQNIHALRLRLKVKHVEIPPATEGTPLEGFYMVLKQENRTLKPEDAIEIPTT